MNKFIINSLSGLLIVISPYLSHAQSAITAIASETSSVLSSTTYTLNGAPSSPLAGNSYDYAFGSASGFTDNQLELKSIQAGGIGYRYEGIPLDVYFRRVNNINVTGVRDLLFYFGTLSGSNINLKASYLNEMNTAFNGNGNLLRGSDNLFANAIDGNGNVNNIERLDVVVSAGVNLISASDMGFALMERGAINQHDAFVVGVITSIDGSGNPLSYSNLIRVSSAAYGSINIVPNQSSVVLRRDNGVGDLRASTSLSGQGIGGIFFKFSDFGVADGQTIYGYSVAASDFPISGTSTDFVNYNNSTYFPLATSGSTEGGIDMIALTGLVKIIVISGNVYNDIDALTNSLVDGVGLSTPSGDQLYINVLNSLNNVVLSQAVNPDGSFEISGVPLGSIKVDLSMNQGVVGNPAPARALPSNWVFTGEKAGSGATPANSEGQALINIAGENITEILFGIQQRPVANSVSLSVQPNPGGNNSVVVPQTAFSGGDADAGDVTQIRFTSFPTGANSITIDGINYTSGTFPPAGVTVAANLSGQPDVVILVDPVDGNVDVLIPYATIDNAGFEPLVPAVITMPFAGVFPPVVNYFPAGGFGTLGYEDLWPATGDYDFNDLVIDYQFEITSNHLNHVEYIKATFIIKAFGASFENGFGFQFNTSIPSADFEVTGSNLTEGFIVLGPKGLEAGQTKPTIIVYDNAFNQMAHPGIGIGVNTDPSAPYVTPDTVVIEINITPETYAYNDLNIANFNPFIFVNKNRSVEVHLPDYEPTDLADIDLLGTLEDSSDPANLRYYKTATNLPWALHIYEQFDYPVEKQQILWAHLKFAEWATSSGVLFPDWYRNFVGYRNTNLIYTRPTN